MSAYEDLDAFKLSYELAKQVAIITRGFPREELFGITSQLNRSPKSVCVNIVEAYRKKQYPRHFLSKLSDADGECSETIVWLSMCNDLNYIPEHKYLELKDGYSRIGRMLGKMMQNPENPNPKKIG
jgi:four helix bundle protein